MKFSAFFRKDSTRRAEEQLSRERIFIDFPTLFFANKAFESFSFVCAFVPINPFFKRPNRKMENLRSIEDENEKKEGFRTFLSKRVRKAFTQTFFV